MRCLALLLLALWPSLASAHAGAVASPDLVVAYRVDAQTVQLGLNVPPKILHALTDGLDGTPEGGWDLSGPLDLDQQRRLMAQWQQIMQDHNAVTVEGAALPPTLTSLTLVHDLPHARLDDLPTAPNVKLHSSPWMAAQLRVNYPRAGHSLDAPITFAWTLPAAFPEATRSPQGRLIPDPGIQATLYPEAGQPVPFTLTRAHPQFTWTPPAASAPASPAPNKGNASEATQPEPTAQTSPVPMALGITAAVILLIGLGRRSLRIPAFMLAVGLGFGAFFTGLMQGAGPMTPEGAVALFTDLHRNIYAAFDQPDPEAIYDTLARSVDGPLLEQIYDEVYESLILAEDGGARTRITAVEVESAEVQPEIPEGGGFEIKARWKVVGEVAHWGHGHRRTNQYTALYTVAPRPAGWRIVGTRLLDQSRETVEVSAALLGQDQGK